MGLEFRQEERDLIRALSEFPPGVPAMRFIRWWSDPFFNFMLVKSANQLQDVYIYKST